MERYLAGGAIKGIGPALAKRIVRKFKGDTFRIIEEEPERLAEIKGISESMAMSISEQAEAKKGMREAVMFMQQYGIGAGLANRIYEKYGPALYAILKSNPYRLAEDIDGIGFRTADSIAMKAGMAQDDRFRIRCGLLYVLMQGALNGHTWLPEEMLKNLACSLLSTDVGDIEPTLIELQIAGKIVMLERKGVTEVYLSAYYHTEKNIAARLKSIAVKGEQDRTDTLKRLKRIEEETGIELDRLRNALAEAVNAHPYIKTRLFMDKDGGIRQKRLDDEAFTPLDVEYLRAGSIDELKKDPEQVRKFFKMYNDSFADVVYNFIPFTEEEIEGLDIGEHGNVAYPDFAPVTAVGAPAADGAGIPQTYMGEIIHPAGTLSTEWSLETPNGRRTGLHAGKHPDERPG